MLPITFFGSDPSDKYSQNAIVREKLGIRREKVNLPSKRQKSLNPAIICIASEVPLDFFIGVSPLFYANFPSDCLLLTARMRGIPDYLAVQLKAYEDFEEEKYDVDKQVESQSFCDNDIQPKQETSGADFDNAGRNGVYMHQTGICGDDFECICAKFLTDASYPNEFRIHPNETISYCMLPVNLESAPFLAMDDLDYVPFRLHLKFEFLRVVRVNDLRTFFDEIDDSLKEELEYYETKWVRKFREFLWLFIESQLFDCRMTIESDFNFALYGRTYQFDDKPRYRRGRHINLCTEAILINIARCLDSIPFLDRTATIKFIVRKYIDLYEHVLRQSHFGDWRNMSYSDSMRFFRQALFTEMLYIDPLADKDNPTVLNYMKSMIAWQNYDSLYAMSFDFFWIQDLVPSQAIQLFSLVSNAISHRTMTMDLSILVKIYSKIHLLLETKLNRKIPMWKFYWTNNHKCQFNIYCQREKTIETMKCKSLITEDVFAFITESWVDLSDYLDNMEYTLNVVEALIA